MTNRNFDEAAEHLATGPAPVTNGNSAPIVEGAFDEETVKAITD